MAKGETTDREPGLAQARINPIIPAGLAVVVVGLLVALIARAAGDGDDPAAVVDRTTSTTTTTLPETTTTTTTIPDPVPVGELLAQRYEEAPVTAYRITYEVVENELAREESWVVRRPYESLIVSTRDGEQISGTATSIEALRTYLSDREGWLTVQAERHRAAFDVRPLPSLGAIVALGRAEEIGDGEYAGRACTRFRTGDPTSVSVATAPSEDQTTEICVDDAGLILHERWELNGSVLSERTATQVTVDPPIDGADFDPEPPIEDAEQYEALLGSIAVEADEETKARLATELTLPPGWTVDSTVLRGSPRGAGGVSSASEIVRFVSNGPDLVEHAEVFGDGPVDLVIPDGVPVTLDDPAAPETWFAGGFRESYVRQRVSESSYVELRGPDPVVLFELLAGMTRR